MNKKDPFKLEKLRQNLASKHKLSELKLLYDKSLPEISDLNTSNFWNERIQKQIDYAPEDGMTRDRINIAYQYIPKTAKRILDIGAGYGYIERLISKNKTIEIYGNDISENAINNLTKKFKGNFKLESIYKMKYEPNSFDTVFMLEVLEHIPPSKTFKVLKDVKKILKKNGCLILSVPTSEGLERMSDNPNGHVRMYTKDLIKAELEIAGFKILEIKTLYAFKNFYFIKNLISKIFKNRWEPNDIVIKAEFI
ncbi:MAG: class I SAM-dependent methyltransferase [Patescibacteria group bacterium]